MNKIFISWQATINDYMKDNTNSVNKITSPNYNFHKEIYNQNNYNEHIILCSEKDVGDDIDKSTHINTQFSSLIGTLKKDFPNNVITKCNLDIEEQTKSLDIILSKITDIALQNKDSELHFSISTGNRIMQLAWMLLHTNERDITSKLIQIEEHQGLWEINTLNIEKSNDTKSAILKSISQEDQNSYCITNTLKPVYEKASNYAQADTRKVSILITGESGTGKEHLANYIHKSSSRREKPYHTINCGAFNDELLRSELFGYQKGSFTGANEDKKGYFELSDGGTLFLDEIGEISPYMQQTLLRVLQSGEFQPIGSVETKKVNVKIISATNKDLQELSKNGKFRLDLLYRLKTVNLNLPPLRERGIEEINTLIEYFLDKFPEEFKSKRICLSSNALKKLQMYSYPGNVRELENVLLGLYAIYKNNIDIEELPKDVINDNSETSFSIEEMKKIHYIKTIKHFKGQKNKKMIYDALGVNVLTFEKMIKKWNININ